MYALSVCVDRRCTIVVMSHPQLHRGQRIRQEVLKLGFAIWRDRRAPLLLLNEPRDAPSIPTRDTRIDGLKNLYKLGPLRGVAPSIFLHILLKLVEAGLAVAILATNLNLADWNAYFCIMVFATGERLPLFGPIPI